MDFDIEDYKKRTGRLVWDDLDFSQFATDPLQGDALRCLRYMHDVEYHTVCYLRDLLMTPAHGDPEVTAFLGFWNVEEFWHGEGLAAVLAAHGEQAGASRVELQRRRLGWRDKLKPITTSLGAALTGQHFTAVHMTWGRDQRMDRASRLRPVGPPCRTPGAQRVDEAADAPGRAPRR